MFRFSLIVAIFFGVVGIPVAFAQSLGNQPDPIQFLVSPEVPAPGDTILIQAQGVGNFLGDATISWQVDGKTVKSGLGERVFSFTAGALGKQTSVRVVVDSPTKGVISKTFTFLPSTVTMLWEAGTTVPPWYKGKALYSAGSSLTVMALPQVILNGKTVTSNNLGFQWSRNGTPVPEISGKGRNLISFEGNQLLSGETLRVDVTINGAVIAQGQITIPATTPTVVMYERDPLRGVLYDSAFPDSVTLTENEIAIQAQPFYFSKNSLSDGQLQYAWKLNGADIIGPDSARGTLTLRQSGTGKGSAALQVELQNTDPSKFVQSARDAVRILFGGTTQTGIGSFFGL